MPCRPRQLAISLHRRQLSKRKSCFSSHHSRAEIEDHAENITRPSKRHCFSADYSRYDCDPGLHAAMGVAAWCPRHAKPRLARADWLRLHRCRGSIAAAGRRMLKSLGTNVSPLQPTTALATAGIYGWTRNPLYSGGTLVMLGIAFIFAVDWLILLIVPSLLVLHFGVVSREEQYLEEKFGDVCRAYKISVSRYGVGI